MATPDGREVVLIAAVAENGVIGAGNRLPWRLPADLRRFRALTTGHTVIMGRRNYESIGKPLPHRTNIVVTRNTGYTAAGCVMVHSFDEALRKAVSDPVFVIGGAEIYRQALPYADTIELTSVHASIAGDVSFPEYDQYNWHEVARESHDADERHAYAYSFVTLRRKTAAR